MKKILPAALMVLICCTDAFAGDLTLWYRQPAAQWVQALPVGNGRLGAMVFGGVGNPPPLGGYREYKMTELQGIMAGIGVPYELGTGDMSQVNYSSWRGGMLVPEHRRELPLANIDPDVLHAGAPPHDRHASDDGQDSGVRGRRSEDKSVRHSVDRTAL